MPEVSALIAAVDNMCRGDNLCHHIREDDIPCFRDNTYTRTTTPNPRTLYGLTSSTKVHLRYPAGYSDTSSNAIREVEVYGNLIY